MKKNVSHSQLMAGLASLAFFLAHYEHHQGGPQTLMPNQLKPTAKKYFTQLVHLAGFSPETMMPYRQTGGQLPEWAKRNQTEVKD